MLVIIYYQLNIATRRKSYIIIKMIIRPRAHIATDDAAPTSWASMILMHVPIANTHAIFTPMTLRCLDRENIRHIHVKLKSHFIAEME